MRRCRTTPGPTAFRQLPGAANARVRFLENEKPAQTAGFFVCCSAVFDQKLSLIQAPQHLIELIKITVANAQNPAAFGFLDGDSEAERIRYPFLQRN
jgi:hypothetical protein